MIYDKIQNCDFYFKDPSAFYRALIFVKSFEPGEPDGRYEIAGEDIYAQVITYAPEPAQQRRFEAHHSYVDVQALILGEERMDVSLSNNLKPLEPYDKKKDVVFLEPPENYMSLYMNPGYFVVFFPHDIHRPNCQINGKIKVRKIVVKIHINIL